MGNFGPLSGLARPRLMGIVNVTADSFSDGGRFLDPANAFEQAESLLDAGAEILDIGGESTRPGSTNVDEKTELDRVIPLIGRIHARYPGAVISVDTRKAEVARQAIIAGASMVNDVSALRFDPAMAEVLAGHPGTRLVLMHMLGEPRTMQQNPRYEDVVGEICDFFAERIAFAVDCGISQDRLLLDPGIGFGKNLEHNLTLLAQLERFREFGLPLVVGASRKRFIDALDPSAPDQRLGGTLSAALLAAWQRADILRVHDVQAHRQFFITLQAIATRAG